MWAAHKVPKGRNKACKTPRLETKCDNKAFKELNSEGREEKLVKRLKDWYHVSSLVSLFHQARLDLPCHPQLHCNLFTSPLISDRSDLKLPNAQIWSRNTQNMTPNFIIPHAESNMRPGDGIHCTRLNASVQYTFDLLYFCDSDGRWSRLTNIVASIVCSSTLSGHLSVVVEAASGKPLLENDQIKRGRPPWFEFLTLGMGWKDASPSSSPSSFFPPPLTPHSSPYHEQCRYLLAPAFWRRQWATGTNCETKNFLNHSILGSTSLRSVIHSLLFDFAECAFFPYSLTWQNEVVGSCLKLENRSVWSGADLDLHCNSCMLGL